MDYLKIPKYFASSMLIYFAMNNPLSAQNKDLNNLKDPRLEVVSSFDKSQPIGVSVSSDNRVFVSFPKRESYTMGLAEIVNGKRTAFPSAKNGEDPILRQTDFINVQDIYVDTKDVLWVLDSKPASNSSIFGKGSSDEKEGGKFTLYGIDLADQNSVSKYVFEDLDKEKSALNDVRVDTEKHMAYFSDPGQTGIVVLDLKTGKTRTVLKNSRFTKADPKVVLSYQGKEMRDAKGNPFKSNVNGIALTKDNKWFYFKPINAHHLYRIETQYLVDRELSDKELVSKVKDMGEVGITHGLVADKEGNIYLTTSLDYSIRRLTPEGSLEMVVQDSRLIWPDSLGIGSDGYLYFSCAQMQLLPNWNNGEDRVEYPFQVYRVKVL
mgnify:CR=1 FL=1